MTWERRAAQTSSKGGGGPWRAALLLTPGAPKTGELLVVRNPWPAGGVMTVWAH